MEFLVVWFVWTAIWIAARMVRKMHAVEEETLCLACVNAVVTRGVRGQKWVACNYAGYLRPVKFAVCDCTGFCGRGGTAKLVTIEGFVPDKREVYAEVAIT
jgi:hypothetical protein